MRSLAHGAAASRLLRAQACQPALPICQATGAGADKPSLQAPSTQPPSPPRALGSACATCCFRLCSPALGSPGPSLPPEVGKRPFPSLYPKSECVGSCWAVKEGTRDPRIHCLSQVLHMGTLIPLQNKSDTCRSRQGLMKVFNSSPHNLGGSP